MSVTVLTPAVPKPGDLPQPTPCKRSVAVLLLDDDHDHAARMMAASEAFDVVLLVADAQAAARVLSELGTENRALVEAAADAGLVVDSRRQVATWREKTLPLSRREREILQCLLSDSGRVWSHEHLHERVWGGNYLGDPSLLHSALKRLRRKLRHPGVPYPIDAVRGIGFRLTAA